MMSQGRCSAKVLLVVSLSLLVLMDSGQVADGALYTVGGQNGWGLGFDSGSWTQGKRFSIGDILVFRYSPTLHNVVAVNRAGFLSCTAPQGAPVYQSGRDQINVRRGANYFICTFPGHCAAGMRIAVNVCC